MPYLLGCLRVGRIGWCCGGFITLAPVLAPSPPALGLPAPSRLVVRCGRMVGCPLRLAAPFPRLRATPQYPGFPSLPFFLGNPLRYLVAVALAPLPLPPPPPALLPLASCCLRHAGNALALP